MINNGFQNCLKFSKNENAYNPVNGILNQNPIIVTKTSAYNFNYTDCDKLRLAQLLVKRDLKNSRDFEANKINEFSVQTETIPQNADQKANTNVRCKTILKKKPLRERVSSIKRVPGPQTPNKINSKKTMPIRSMSPPTKDNDAIWRPKQENDVICTKENEMDKLRKKVDECTSKLDGLERNLRVKSQDAASEILVAGRAKSGRELAILSDKLRQLMAPTADSADPKPVMSARDRELPSVGSTPKAHNVDMVLAKLDSLVRGMGEIQCRWRKLAYEDVSLCSLDEGASDDDMRFTRGKVESWQDYVPDIDDGKVELDFSAKVVARLDGERRRAGDSLRYAGVPMKMLHVDWLAEDLVEEIVGEIVNQVDDMNNKLVEDILNAELAE